MPRLLVGLRKSTGRTAIRPAARRCSIISLPNIAIESLRILEQVLQTHALELEKWMPSPASVLSRSHPQRLGSQAVQVREEGQFHHRRAGCRSMQSLHVGQAHPLGDDRPGAEAGGRSGAGGGPERSEGLRPGSGPKDPGGALVALPLRRPRDQLDTVGGRLEPLQPPLGPTPRPIHPAEEHACSSHNIQAGEGQDGDHRARDGNEG